MFTDDHVRQVESIADRLRGELQDAVAMGGNGEPEVDGPMNTALAALSQLACWGPQNRLPSSHLWNRLRDWLEIGSLQTHARTKPLGYPGDFRLLDRICRVDVAGEGLARAWDRYFQAQAAPQAVRNRCRWIADRVTAIVRARPDSAVQVLSVGCGPGWDLRWGLERLAPEERPRLQVTLWDLDPRGLEFAAEQLQPLLPAGQLHTCRVNLKRRFLQPPGEEGGRFDLVLCPGFADYLDDAEFVDCLRFLGSSLRNQGEMAVLNFSETNPSRAYMEWIGNWYLHYRSANDLWQLADQAGLRDVHWEVGAEPLQVNRFVQGVRRAESPGVGGKANRGRV